MMWKDFPQRMQFRPIAKRANGSGRLVEPIMAASILLIDDDAATIQKVQPALRQDGYEVAHAQPGIDAIRTVLVDQPDLVILGINSQKEDWEFCRRLMTFLNHPLLLLLATKSQMDRLKGFELGADDCMVKPVVMVELAARARALLRWSASQTSRRPHNLFVDDDLIVDLARREVQLNNRPVALTPTEFRVLVCFIKHAEEALSHEEILAEVWGLDHESRRDILKLYVHSLRQKLEPDPSRPKRILTRRGEGYVLKRLAQGRE
jgi:DNA-binding response OmpR family regulator